MGSPTTLVAPGPTRSTVPAVTCRGLTKTFDRDLSRSWRHAVPGWRPTPTTPVVALAGVDLDLAAGQPVGIIGPNGAGKSTLLRLVVGVADATAGSVEVHGTVRAMIELGVGFHPALTGWENLRCSGVVLGRTPADVRAAEYRIAEFAGLLPAMDRPLHQYSDGMRARLAMALAVDGRPDVLAVDEVLAVGDREFQAACVDRINALIAAGTTVLYVSHDLSLVGQLCERVVHLRGGHVVDDGPAADVIERYLTRTATRLRPSGADGPATVHSCRVRSGGADGHLEITGEITVHEPIAQPALGVDFTLPTIDPTHAVSSALDAIGPLTEPGTYTVVGRGQPLSFFVRNLRLSLTLVDEAAQRTVDAASIDLPWLGEGNPAELGPRGFAVRVPVDWEMRALDRRQVETLPDRAARPTIGEPVVAVRGATKRYRTRDRHGSLSAVVPGITRRARADDVVALDEIDVEVARGEALGIIGPNAAGKSTLLRVIAGITALDRGSLAVSGNVASALGLSAGFHGDLTGRESLRTLLRLHRVPADERTHLEERIVEFAGLGDAIDAEVKQYSSGMHARLSMSAALHLPADILLVDEALAVGDEEFRRAALAEVERRHAAGATILLVSHELQMIEQLCTRVIRLDGGRIVDDGSTDEVLARYASPSWASGVEDASGGVRLLPLDVARSAVPLDAPIEVVGRVVVDQPLPNVRLELTVRAQPVDRSAAFTATDRAFMNISVTTVVPSGRELSTPGAYEFRCTARVEHVVGAMDLVVSAVDEFDGRILAESWHEIQVGSPEPGGVPSYQFDLEWTVEPGVASTGGPP